MNLLKFISLIEPIDITRMKYTWVGPSGVKITASLNNGNSHNFIKIPSATNHEDTSQSFQNSTKKNKRYRSAFTTDQINYLEQQFQKFPYIGIGHRKEVSSALNIPERAVKIWFQNRRMKEKKDTRTKELDEHQPEEFGKEPLNNVLDVQLPNEPKSLPLLVSQDTCAMSIGKKEKTVPQILKMNYSNELTCSKENPTSTVQEHSLPARSNESSVYNNTAQFSNDLCKNNNQESPHVSNNNLNIGSRNPSIPQLRADKRLPEVQDSPQDLSAWKKTIISPSVNVSRPKVSTSSGFVPVIPSFYAQPYFPQASMLWNPINVMPIMSTGGSAVAISSNQSGHLSVHQDHVQRKCCSCDCHLVNPVHRMPMSFQGEVHPHYILTTVPHSSITSKY